MLGTIATYAASVTHTRTHATPWHEVCPSLRRDCRQVSSPSRNRAQLTTRDALIAALPHSTARPAGDEPRSSAVAGTSPSSGEDPFNVRRLVVEIIGLACETTLREPGQRMTSSPRQDEHSSHHDTTHAHPLSSHRRGRAAESGAWI